MSKTPEVKASFKKYIFKRILQTIPLIFFIIIVDFMVIHIAPGDPSLMFISGEEDVMAEEFLEKIRHRMGLDKPLHVQLYLYISQTLRGNFGNSFIYQRPVMDIIMERAPNTLLLMGTGLIFSTIFGILFGVLASRKQSGKLGRLVEFIINNISIIGYAIPVFWLGQLLILFFSVYLGWLPMGGIVSLRKELNSFEYFSSVLQHLILPLICVSWIQLAGTTRFTKSSMDDVLDSDYIKTARAKGLDERVVYFKHALRNALLPVITMLGLRIGFLISGAVITETVFSWPGLGRVTFEAVLARDYPLLLGMFFLISTTVVLAQLLIDILYALLDPRIRYI